MDNDTASTENRPHPGSRRPAPRFISRYPPGLPVLLAGVWRRAAELGPVRCSRRLGLWECVTSGDERWAIGPAGHCEWDVLGDMPQISPVPAGDGQGPRCGVSFRDPGSTHLRM